jgi:hypothetical protein
MTNLTTKDILPLRNEGLFCLCYNTLTYDPGAGFEKYPIIRYNALT